MFVVADQLGVCDSGASIVDGVLHTLVVKQHSIDVHRSAPVRFNRVPSGSCDVREHIGGYLRGRVGGYIGVIIGSFVGLLIRGYKWRTIIGVIVACA